MPICYPEQPPFRIWSSARLLLPVGWSSLGGSCIAFRWRGEEPKLEDDPERPFFGGVGGGESEGGLIWTFRCIVPTFGFGRSLFSVEPGSPKVLSFFGQDSVGWLWLGLANGGCLADSRDTGRPEFNLGLSAARLDTSKNRKRILHIMLSNLFWKTARLWWWGLCWDVQWKTQQKHPNRKRGDKQKSLRGSVCDRRLTCTEAKREIGIRTMERSLFPYIPGWTNHNIVIDGEEGTFHQWKCARHRNFPYWAWWIQASNPQ